MATTMKHTPVHFELAHHSRLTEQKLLQLGSALSNVLDACKAIDIICVISVK